MKLPSMQLSRELLSNFENAITKEWIVANGLGGYASSTILGLNTRKYHGLLIAALNPPSDRRVCLAKLDEEVNIGNKIYPLGTNEFQDKLYPQGHFFLKEFSIAPFPKYVYEVENIAVQKLIFMPRGKNAVISEYDVSNKNGFDVKIRVYPIINMRPMNCVTNRQQSCWNLVQRQREGEVKVGFSIPQATLMLRITSGQYSQNEKWIEKVCYREEAARGESCFDDYFQLGFFEIGVKANKEENFAIVAIADKNETDAVKHSAELPFDVHGIKALYKTEIELRENLLAHFYRESEKLPESDWLSWVILALNMFGTESANKTQNFVIAGYHWFGSWGRDTFIALPGLMLIPRKFKEAQNTFLTFSSYCKDGLIPNFIPEGTEPLAYNAVDATLWFINAILQYLKYTGDFRFVRDKLWKISKNIIANYVNGTVFGIRVDADGLLSHSAQLTWMDATVNGEAVTPRAGKAVEVQALWYNTVKIMELLANRFGEKDEAERFSQMAEKAKESFAEKFWNIEKNCLFDVVNEQCNDLSLRPNQIIAVALNFTMLDNIKNEKIVDTVCHELLTPYGLRTLARNDPRYVGEYVGDRRSRDKTYHNGTVWPWLLGPFTTAFLKTKGYAIFRREHALKSFLVPLFTEQTCNAGIGVISEIFDGDPPHTPRGCIAQAWSVAEPFRAYVEDVMLIRPPYEKQVLRRDYLS